MTLVTAKGCGLQGLTRLQVDLLLFGIYGCPYCVLHCEEKHKTQHNLAAVIQSYL